MQRAAPRWTKGVGKPSGRERTVATHSSYWIAIHWPRYEQPPVLRRMPDRAIAANSLYPNVVDGLLIQIALPTYSLPCPIRARPRPTCSAFSVQIHRQLDKQ